MVSTAKAASNKIRALTPSIKFLSPKIALVNLLYSFAWKTVAEAPGFWLDNLDRLQISLSGTVRLPLVPIPCSRGRPTQISNRLQDFSVCKNR